MALTERFTHPRVIWLQPWCAECEKATYRSDEGRMWCQDDAWGKCEECGRLPIKYKMVARDETVT